MARFNVLNEKLKPKKQQVGAPGQVEPTAPQVPTGTPGATAAPPTTARQFTPGSRVDQLLGGALQRQEQQAAPTPTQPPVQPKTPTEAPPTAQPAPTTPEAPAEPTAPPRQVNRAYTDYMNVKRLFDTWIADKNNMEKRAAFLQARNQYDINYAKRYHNNISWHNSMTPPPQVAPTGSPEATSAAEDRLRGREDEFDRATEDAARAAETEYKFELENGRHVMYKRVPGGDWERVEGDVFSDRTYGALDEARRLLDAGPKNISEWMQQADPQFGQWQDVPELLKRAQRVEEEWAKGTLGPEAREQAAAILGFNNAEELAQFMRSEMQNVQVDPNDPNLGLSEEERRVRNRDHHNRMRMLQAQAERDIDAIFGETGSNQRAWAMSEQYRRGIQDANAQHAATMAQEDFMRRNANLEWKKARFDMLVRTGAATQFQASQMVLQERGLQMQNMAFQLQGALAQNQQLMALSAHDQSMLESFVNMNLTLADREAGLDLAVHKRMDNLYEKNLRPHLIKMQGNLELMRNGLAQWQTAVGAEMQQRQIDAQAEAAKRQAESDIFSAIFGFVGTIGGALIGGLFAGPAGAGVGASVGGGLLGLKLTP